ncbi:MAG: hypothetical protein P8X57_02675 [Cyclobacteriaceae bacterium]
MHNILEAAVFGVPVFFGNRNYLKYREAVELINLGGAFTVGNYVVFREKFNSLQINDSYQIAREINTQYIQSQLGATKMILEYMNKTLGE